MSLSDNTTKIASVLAKVKALPAQLDTSDATAAASDIVKNKTAYVNGEKVTGSREKVSQLTENVTSKAILNGFARFVGKVTQNAAIDVGNSIGLSLGAGELGNADDADVAKGKTYTSAAGFKRTGTHEEAVIETAALSLTGNALAQGIKVWYINGSGNLQTETYAADATITVKKSTIVFFAGQQFATIVNGVTENYLVSAMGGTPQPFGVDGISYSSVMVEGDLTVNVAGIA